MVGLVDGCKLLGYERAVAQYVHEDIVEWTELVNDFSHGSCLSSAVECHAYERIHVDFVDVVA